MRRYIGLSDELQERIQRDRENHIHNPYAFPDERIVRRNTGHDKASLWRPAFVRDCEKIMHIPYYNRYADKTQVFSLYKNDDISRRALHVQLVSRIARNIGRLLNLNTDLIEAVALGHDIGHTPFGHAGERKLNELYHGQTGRYFHHNIQSARVLDIIFPANISLQTLDGIICHNGEMEMEEYRPQDYDDFQTFDTRMEACYTQKDAVHKLIPATLEACVVRVSDIIAYLGKDRQDAVRLELLDDDNVFDDMGIGTTNAEIINNMSVNIVENSYGKPYLSMDKEFYEAFSVGKKENYQIIYRAEANTKIVDEQVFPMIEELYFHFLDDMKMHNRNSLIYTHHIDYVKEQTKYFSRQVAYEELPPDDIVADYIAGMTDDYLIDLYRYLFPKGRYQVDYVGYFDV